jgi:hypothetical protein
MQYESWMPYAGIAVVVLGMFWIFALKLLTSKTINLPTVQDIQELATVFSTKGGFILALLVMWFWLIIVAVSFGIWVISKGIDPQNAIVVTILAMLVSTAFGGVCGALFTAFKGDDPKAPPGVTSETSRTVVQTTEVQQPTILTKPLVDAVSAPEHN